MDQLWSYGWLFHQQPSCHRSWVSLRGRLRSAAGIDRLNGWLADWLRRSTGFNFQGFLTVGDFSSTMFLHLVAERFWQITVRRYCCALQQTRSLAGRNMQTATKNVFLQSHTQLCVHTHIHTCTYSRISECFKNYTSWKSSTSNYLGTFIPNIDYKILLMLLEYT